MKCSDLQSNLAFYADGLVGGDEHAAVTAHLEVCPVCRQRNSEYREIHASLRQMRRPEIPAALRNTLKESVRVGLRSEKSSWLPLSSDIREWLQMRVMPYGVGVFASCVIGVAFLSMMFSGLLKSGNIARSPVVGQTSIMLATNSNPFNQDYPETVATADYVQSRLGFANESPSINPHGALIALTKSLVRGGMKDDEVVVVADVFGNGLAQIAEVVEPSRDRRAVGELEKALESDPAFAPFVPSSMENRPESVRVVLKFQSVNVSTNQKRRKL